MFSFKKFLRRKISDCGSKVQIFTKKFLTTAISYPPCGKAFN